MSICSSKAKDLALIAVVLACLSSAGPGLGQQQSRQQAQASSAGNQVDQSQTQPARRESTFLTYLLIGCSLMGVGIAFAVWRSMPPKPKPKTDSK